MIQINLLPDIKQEYLRTKRTRNFVVSIAIVAGLASIGLVVALLLFLGTQTALEIRADNRIEQEYQTLSEIDDLSELVTLQNQLSLISDQHDTKSMGSRLFAILQAVNPPAPNDVRFTTVNMDPSTNTLRLEGIASGGYRAVETLAKTISNTSIRYTAEQEPTTEDLATKVAIDESSFSEDADGRRVLRFSILVEYNELLFSNQAQRMQVSAPDRRIDVTDSRVRVPESLFAASPTEEEEN